MSSIFGIINFGQKPVEAAKLAKMEHLLNHWGADASAVWQLGYVGLGTLMFYNTPESVFEKQPLYHGASGLAITADVRLDNRDELYTKLNLPKGNALLPDSFLLLKCYERYGAECLAHLVGDFAFAIWDDNKKMLFCARDHMGVKPFFYYQDASFFAFASEKKGLLALGGKVTEINEEYIWEITGGFSPAEIQKTCYRHIFRLLPAHSAQLNGQVFRDQKYWELNIQHQVYFKNPDDYAELFREKFTEAIKCRLRSAHLIATELSGGLDSSGITCVAANLLHANNKKIVSLSLAADEETLSTDRQYKRDYELINAVHQFAGIDYPIILNESGYVNWTEELDLFLQIFDGPEFCSMIWSLPLKKNAALGGARTLLSGFGGDELVTNFSSQYYLDALARNEIFKFFSLLTAEASFLKALKILIQYKADFLIKHIAAQNHPRKQLEHLLTSPKNFLTPQYLAKILKPARQHNALPVNFKEVQKRLVENPFNTLRFEAETLAGYGYRIETRFPMIDKRLMEYVIALPAEQKIKPGLDRFLFRNAMKQLLPAEVINEKVYSGLSKPFANLEWIKNQTQKLQWLEALEEQEKIPDFINLEKTKKGYMFTLNNKLNFNYSRIKQVEVIIRFLTYH